MTRVYIDQNIRLNEILTINFKHSHYIFNVLRMKIGQSIYVFNQNDGEWIAELNNKNTVKIISFVKQYNKTKKLSLAFAPLANSDRMRFMIEKATEIGVTDFYPLITQRTHAKHFNMEKLLLNSIEACEQCGRINIPIFHEKTKLEDMVCNNFVVALERSQGINKSLQDISGVIIGPEGGFSDIEKKILINKFDCISLSKNILRSETAAIVALSLISHSL